MIGTTNYSAPHILKYVSIARPDPASVVHFAEQNAIAPVGDADSEQTAFRARQQISPAGGVPCLINASSD